MRIETTRWLLVVLRLMLKIFASRYSPKLAARGALSAFSERDHSEVPATQSLLLRSIGEGTGRRF
jgi:hypothetical protein